MDLKFWAFSMFPILGWKTEVISIPVAGILWNRRDISAAGWIFTAEI